MGLTPCAVRSTVELWVPGVGFSDLSTHRRDSTALDVNVATPNRTCKPLPALLFRQDEVALLHPALFDDYEARVVGISSGTHYSLTCGLVLRLDVAEEFLPGIAEPTLAHGLAKVPLQNVLRGFHPHTFGRTVLGQLD